MTAATYKVHAKYPDGSYGNYDCVNGDDLQDMIWFVEFNGGKVTWVGKKYILGYINGYQMYEYREMKEVYI
jgi:hypothetical protein